MAILRAVTITYDSFVGEGVTCELSEALRGESALMRVDVLNDAIASLEDLRDAAEDEYVAGLEKVRREALE